MYKSYIGLAQLLVDCLTSRISVGQPIETLTLDKNIIARMSISCEGLPSQTTWMDLVQVVEYERGDEV